ncbi:MAG TPA: LytR C-terminal domain-containing protein [Acidimicrobiales bacterium]|nr:LytR C-terminal domain-containing protein [Acidimicrobiales bacterium]
MQTTERPPTGPTRGGQSPVRGVVLVCVAVVIGFFVLRAMDNTSADVVAVDSKATTTTTTAAGGAAGKTGTTAAKPQARPPAQVTVLVANASGVGRAAAKQTDKLKAAGYKTGAPGNAPQGLNLAETQVMAMPGFEADAKKLATDLGKPNAVKPMATPPPVNMAGANVLVLLGTDLAQG